MGVVVHIWNPSSWEASQVEHESKASLDYIVRPYLKQTKAVLCERRDHKNPLACFCLQKTYRNSATALLGLGDSRGDGAVRTV